MTKFQAATIESICSAINELGGRTTAPFLTRFLQHRDGKTSYEAQVGIQRAIENGQLKINQGLHLSVSR